LTLYIVANATCSLKKKKKGNERKYESMLCIDVSTMLFLGRTFAGDDINGEEQKSFCLTQT